MTHTFSTTHRAALAVFGAAELALAPLARAAGNCGGGTTTKPQISNGRTDKRTNNVRSTSVNNVNKNVKVNVDNDRGCCSIGWDNDYHPIATAAAVTATVAVTSAIVRSIVNAPPPGLRAGELLRLHLPAVRQRLAPAAGRAVRGGHAALLTRLQPRHRP